MFVIRLPNGNLMVPQTATGNDGRILGDVYVEIGPQDADYARLAEQAVTPEEAERRRDQWRQDDEALRQEFLEFARLNGEHTWQDTPEGEESLTRGLRAAGPRGVRRSRGSAARIRCRRAAGPVPRTRGTCGVPPE